MERNRKKQNNNERPPRSNSQPPEDTQRRKSMKSRSTSEFAPTERLPNSPSNYGVGVGKKWRQYIAEEDDDDGDLPWDNSGRDFDQPDIDTIRDRLKLGKSCADRCLYNRVSDPFCLCQLHKHRPALAIRPRFAVKEEPEPTTPSGLKNLGNTCYMNSYLQTWFHLLPVRKVVYEWRRPPVQQLVPGMRYEIVSELQKLFAELQLNRKSSADPSGLVISGKLDTAVQQDAQEFAVLFLDWLDQVIAERKGEEKVQSLFTGKWRTTLSCRTCHATSSTESDFHDFSLDIDDIHDVMTSIFKFFKPEQIDDYECAKCKTKRVAEKTIQLTKLPRYLNLHLLRTVFDRKMQVPRKLTHAVEFPQILDLRSFLTEAEIRAWGADGCRYELTAILIHLGGASGGHYVVRVRLSTDGQWYTFNDDYVSLYSQPDANADARGAYLLVYEKRSDVERDAKPAKLPPYLDTNPSADDSGAFGKKRIDEVRRAMAPYGVRQFLGSLKPKHRPMIWLPIDWLADIVRMVDTRLCDCPIEPPDMRTHLCHHGKLEGVEKLKATDAGEARTLLSLLKVKPIPNTCDCATFCKSCCKFMYDDEKDKEKFR